MLPAEAQTSYLPQLRFHKDNSGKEQISRNILTLKDYAYLLAEKPEGSNILPSEIQMVSTDQPTCDFI